MPGGISITRAAADQFRKDIMTAGRRDDRIHWSGCEERFAVFLQVFREFGAKRGNAFDSYPMLLRDRKEFLNDTRRPV